MKRASSLLAILALLAIFCQGLIPAGTMPDFSAHKSGLFALTICTGMGTKIINMPADQYDPARPMPHQVPDDKTPPCPYAVASLLSLVFLWGLVLLAFVPVAGALFLAAAAPVAKLRFFGNVSSRGPPLVS